MYLGTLMGALQENGMPSFADRLSVEEMTDIQNYLIKRSHDLRKELKEAGFDGE
jgi:quinohemoprotein ethanol dehydrogenase